MNSKFPFKPFRNSFATSSLGKLIIQALRIFPLKALAIARSPHADICDLILLKDGSKISVDEAKDKNEEPWYSVKDTGERKKSEVDIDSFLDLF